VNKSFGTHQVLINVTLEVPKGEVLCVIGPSGSGKTTFLRCINHLEEIDSGTIRVNGHFVGYRLDEAGQLRREKARVVAQQRTDIGFVFQRFNLWPHRTALENIIEAPIRVRGIGRDEAVTRAEALLGMVHLSEKRDAYPGKLSGGQQQRVAIARALAMDPTVMLFDEATSALDPETTGEVLDVMRGLAEGGMTMIVVTHEMGFARRVADRMVMMEAGRIVEDRGVEEFFTAPSSERTHSFLQRLAH
jgi:polar amino acid transport system ATP-binding protein